MASNLLALVVPPGGLRDPRRGGRGAGGVLSVQLGGPHPSPGTSLRSPASSLRSSASSLRSLPNPSPKRHRLLCSLWAGLEVTSSTPNVFRFLRSFAVIVDDEPNCPAPLDHHSSSSSSPVPQAARPPTSMAWTWISSIPPLLFFIAPAGETGR